MHTAKGFLGQGVSLGHKPGDAEVCHLHRAVLQHHHIVGLDIPVDNAAAVGMLQSLGNLNAKVQGFLPVQGTLGLHIVFQGDALNQLHNDIVCHNGGRHVINRDNIGMAQHGYSLALRMETAAEILITQVIIF